jgi:hypothetical protein
MFTLVGMLRRVFVRGTVATTRPAAFLARSQVDPRGADLDAVLAFAAIGLLDRRDSGDVRAGFFHRCLASVLLRR